MTIPLWATIVGLSLAKKVTVLIAAKLYGIPRLYRRSQKAVRFVPTDMLESQPVVPFRTMQRWCHVLFRWSRHCMFMPVQEQ